MKIGSALLLTFALGTAVDAKLLRHGRKSSSPEARTFKERKMAADKVDVCHYSEDEDVWFKINIAEKAYPAHEDHGDASPGQPVPGRTGFEFDDDCRPVTMSPTKNPTTSPSKNPTESPTKNPSASPSKSPSKTPTESPTKNPTAPLPICIPMGAQCDPQIRCCGACLPSGECTDLTIGPPFINPVGLCFSDGIVCDPKGSIVKCCGSCVPAGEDTNVYQCSGSD